MWRVNLKVLVVVLGTVAVYTWVAAAIPQVASEVPEELTFTGAVTAEQLVAAGEALFHGAGGCEACHGLGARAPRLLADEGGAGAIGARCGSRVEGLDCKAYLHTSMVDPNAFVVEGFQPIMPDMRRTLSDAQIWSIIAFLQSHGGEVTVTAEDVQAAEGAGSPGEGGAGAPAGAAVPSTTMEPVALLREHTCLACHRLGDEGGPIGPPFDDIGARRTADQIRRSILEPNVDTTAGYESMAGTMPATFGQQLTAAQLEALVRYLSERRGG